MILYNLTLTTASKSAPREKYILNFKQPIRKISWNKSVHRHWLKMTQLFGNPSIYKVCIENINFVDNNNVPYVPMFCNVREANGDNDPDMMSSNRDRKFIHSTNR